MKNNVQRFLQNLFSVNPIIVKEIRSRMRGPRAFITLTVSLLAMGGIMYGMVQIILAQRAFNNILSPQVGQTLFATLVFVELFMICAITPAVTAGAVSSEKEKQTYEMLMATPLSATSILWGKLISALSYIFLLLFAGIPLASVVFIFGGVAISDMLKSLLVLVLFAVAFGILGLFYSALFGRTGRSTVASFITVVLLMIGPLFLAIVISIMRNNSEPPRWILAPSPISALSATLASSFGQNSAGGLFYALGGLFNMGVAPISQTNIPRPLYHYTVPFYAILSMVLYMLSTRLVQPTHRWRMSRKDLFIGLGSLVLVIGLIVGGYFATAKRYEWAVNPQAGQNGGVVQAVPAMGQTGPMIQKQVIVQPVQEDQPQLATATPLPLLTATPTGSPHETAAPAGESVIDDSAQAEIYTAIANQLFTVDNTFGGGKPNWQILYLINATDDGIGDPNAPKNPSVTISLPIQGAVANHLMTGLQNVKVAWIDKRDQAQIDPKTGLVADGRGVIMTFGNIQPQKDGTVHVSASLYFASLGGGGKTYILSKVDGAWKITGTTGVEWIS
jgi:ABC-2 type transport system permease protein